MPETEIPHESLAHKAVSVRAAATRDLARDGSAEDVAVLLERVTLDKSPSVRLYAAAAAAEILMRHRGAYDQKPLKSSTRDEILGAVSRIDPAVSPSITLCYSAFPTTEVMKRLCRMLRDPRSNVRAGASAAIRRMALSGAAVEEGTNLREWVGDALDHAKLPTDAHVEMVRLVGEVGWEPLRPRVKRATATRGVLGEAATEALARLDSRADPESWSGVWVDEGRDVQQLQEPNLCDCRAIAEVEIKEGQITLEGLGRARMVYAPRLGEQGSFRALQCARRTWWRLEGKALVSFIDADRDLEAYTPYAQLLAGELDAVPGAASMRAQALLWLRVGEPAKTVEVLAAALAGKKPRNDLFFLQAMALRALGDKAGSKSYFARYLEKAKKKDAWRLEAESLTK